MLKASWKSLATLSVVGVVVGVVLVVAQSSTWTTGRISNDPLKLSIGSPDVDRASRVWIDTDAACGATPRTDPDDCFAIVWLSSHGFNIVGISTSFGNADGNVVEQTVHTLVAKMTQNGMPNILMWKGLAAPRTEGGISTEKGVTELQAALEAGPLTILALGPLTNVAAALESKPDLQGNVSQIVAVMGHRPGHLFHPTEGKGADALLGHGPIFRDLNFAVDPAAAELVLTMNLPLVLVPYDAAHGLMITGPDLDLFSHQGPVQQQLTETARGWLAFWNNDIGLPGFYPFDWVAAAFLVEPNSFRCAKTMARVSWEWAFWFIPRKGLLIGGAPLGSDTRNGVIYCPDTTTSLHDFLLSRPRG